MHSSLVSQVITPVFQKIDQKSPYFKDIKQSFEVVLTEVYGNQEKHLEKIINGADRTCEVLLIEDRLIGFIVYKNQPQNEYGLENHLELKTLLIFDPRNNSKEGYGSLLFKRIDEIAKEKNCDGIFCTASSKKMESINCARKNGYFVDLVLENTEEKTIFLLTKPVQ